MIVLPFRLTDGRRSSIRTFAWIAAALLGLALAVKLVQQIDRPTEFYSYFTAAHLVMEGQSIARFYDDAWFATQTERLAGLHEVFSPNPPTTAIIYAPLALIQSPVEARAIWTMLSVPVLIAFIEALIKLAGTGPATRPIWYIAALAADPIRANLFEGQAYIVVGLGLALAVNFWQARSDTRAGTTLSALLAYKSAGTAIWPVALFARRWNVVLTGIAAFALIVIATLPAVGLDSWLAYLNNLKDVANSSGMRVTAYQSIESITRHLLSGEGGPGSPIFALPLDAARGIAMLIALSFLGVTLYAAHKHADDELILGAAILLTVILVPVSQMHSYAIAFVPIAQLAKRLQSASWGWNWLMAGIGSALVIVPLPYGSPRLIDGWAALLAYPKLYGALILWTVCIVLVSRQGRRPAPSRAVRP